MQKASPLNSANELEHEVDASMALCAGLLPVWARHLAASRAQSSTAVAEMLSAFNGIGLHLDKVKEHSLSINKAVAPGFEGGPNLAMACQNVLAPALSDPQTPESARVAISRVIAMVGASMEALSQVAGSFQVETNAVAAEIERMYIGFQYQDRVSQMLALLESDMARLQAVLSDRTTLPPQLSDWLTQLESQYAMAEQRNVHHGTEIDDSKSGSGETTFF